MPKETLSDFLTYLFGEAGFKPAGLMPTRRCYLNSRFALAMLAGVLVVWVMHVWVQPYPPHVEFNGALLLSLIIWQPLLEEVLFRGILQGQLSKRAWGKNSWLGISGANAVTSALFVAMHMINSPPLFALTVFAPSLVFGYFRDRCNSVYPCMVIHSAYNAMVFVGLILNGNMNIPSI